LACGLKASGTAFFEPSLALSLDERASSVSISLGASGLEEAGKPREPLAFHAALSARAAVAPWLSVMASLALDAGGPGGKAPTMGSTIRLKLPLSPQGQDGRAGSLGLSLDWKAMSLVVLQQGGEGPVPTLGLSWSSSLHLPLSGPGP
jgi:hypothetical protein